jgi:hypothetical protein
MSVFTVEDIKKLIEEAQGFCVSIYMPTVVAGAETRQNSIRFKNLVKQAQQKLMEIDFSEDEANEFLRPMTEELDQEEFWQNQDRGIAIFVTDGLYRYFKLPRDIFELVVVTEQPHIKPLLPLLTGDGQFYLLELSQKKVKLYAGDRMGLKCVEVSDLPQNLEEALQYDGTAADGQFRIGTTAGASNFSNSSAGTGVFHGQGAGDRDEHQKDILQFFHLVDDAVTAYLQDKRAPLVLAGVEYLLPLYRSTNEYPHLVEDAITGNVKVESLSELHQKAWEIVEPHFTRVVEDAASYYRDLSSTAVTSTELSETVSAAYYGRVQQLFVAVGVQRWGQFNAMADEIAIHSDPEPGDEDLLDAAAIQTLMHGGVVYAVEPEKMPDESAIAAVFRY